MSTPLRAILHVLQIIFLLFALVLYAMLVANMFDADDIIWDAEYELAVGASITSVLFAIAFSPGLWSVAKNVVSTPAAGSGAPVAGQAPPPSYGPTGGQPPPPASGQAPPPISGQAPPPGTYGR